MNCLSQLSGETLTHKIQNRSVFGLNFSVWNCRVRKRPRQNFHPKPPQRSNNRIRKKSRITPGSLPWQNKTTGLRRPKREFLGNYKTALGKEEALQKVIGKDLEEGLVSGPYSLEQLSSKYPKALLNSLGAEIKDLTKPDVRMLVGATHGGRQPAYTSNNATNKTKSCRFS